MRKTLRILSLEPRKMLLVIFLIALILRLILPFVREFVVAGRPFFFSGKELMEHFKSDQEWYNYTAKSILQGTGFSLSFTDKKSSEIKLYQNHPHLFRKKSDGLKHNYCAPVYPAFLALSYSLFGLNVLAFFIPQAVLGALTCVFIYLIADKLFGRATAALAGLMTAFYPDLIFWTYSIRLETLLAFLLAACFLLLIENDFDGKVLMPFAIGALMGLTALTRVTFFFFIPIVLVWKFWFSSANKVSVLKSLIAMVVGVGFVILPWAYRNYVVFGNFTILTDERAATFLGIESGNDVFDRNIYNTPFFIYYFRIIFENFRGFLSRTVWQFFKMLGPFITPLGNLSNIYKGIYWLVIFPAAFYGMWLAARRRLWSACLLTVFIVYFILIHSISHVDDGLIYRFPIQPLLCVFAAFSYSIAYDNRLKNMTRVEIK